MWRLLEWWGLERTSNASLSWQTGRGYVTDPAKHSEILGGALTPRRCHIALQLRTLYRYIMKLFRGSSGKSKQQAEPVKQEEQSIGSELSKRDQFDIVVAQRPSSLTNRNSSRPKSNRSGLFSYFSADDDNSTVSSITVDDRRRFMLFHNARQDYSVTDSGSSWCCCSDNPAAASREHHSAENTLLANPSFLTSQPYLQARHRYERARTLQGKAAACYAGHACGPECAAAATHPAKASSPKGRRPRLFRRGNAAGGAAAHNQESSIMSSSLFDTLSDDWDEEDGEGGRGGGGGSSKRAMRGMRRRSQQLRRTLTWKRNKA